MWLLSKESHKKLTYATKLHWKSVLPFVIPTEAEGSAVSLHPHRLFMPAELMSWSVSFEPISTNALYQGTTSVVPHKPQMTRALAPGALFPFQSDFGPRQKLNLP
jgi:hypothetical protein